MKFANKSLLMFEYYLAVTNKITFEIQSNRIEIFLNNDIRLEPFGDLKLNINFKAFLPQQL